VNTLYGEGLGAVERAIGRRMMVSLVTRLVTDLFFFSSVYISNRIYL
jgi:hypothetical protein